VALASSSAGGNAADAGAVEVEEGAGATGVSCERSDHHATTRQAITARLSPNARRPRFIAPTE